MSFRLDDIDRKILFELQIDAGQSLDQIAQKVSSSKTPVWNRIKKMKDDTGLRNRSEGIFKRDQWTFQKCKEIYFPYDVQKLKKAIK